MPYDQYEFELKPLPYGYSGLEPYIDTQTVEIHHDKHLKTYVDNLNKALAPYPAYHNWSLEKLLKNTNALPRSIQIPVKNNGGGVYNHNLYFDMMTGRATYPLGRIKQRLISDFGSIEDFEDEFKKVALDVFGSGYAWLASNNYGKLTIHKTANQDTILTYNLCPITLIDVWEHAYYLKYKNQRANYIESWFNLIDWGKMEDRYLRCIVKY